ncbi:hypothetical protein WJX72_000136 [[Myrmecia] bisecta]|uniref:Uncharacterized protein n=1 Tax=[Myrmecia] bisecta TaxID=41462 RepID=A0AAW1QDY5_9CHLO
MLAQTQPVEQRVGDTDLLIETPVLPALPPAEPRHTPEQQAQIVVPKFKQALDIGSTALLQPPASKAYQSRRLPFLYGSPEYLQDAEAACMLAGGEPDALSDSMEDEPDGVRHPADFKSMLEAALRGETAVPGASPAMSDSGSSSGGSGPGGPVIAAANRHLNQQVVKEHIVFEPRAYA